MSTMSSTIDKQGVTSSLSAEAAEFVPLSSHPSQTNTPPPLRHPSTNTPRPKWKGRKPVGITEVPRYLTSCYPFVSPEDAVRAEVARFPPQFPYPGGVPHTVPMPAPPPIRFPPWQAVRPGFVGNYPPNSYGSVPFDPAASAVPLEVPKVRGDGLLPTPPQMDMSVPPIPGQGLLLPSQPDPLTSWVMTTPPPMFVQQPSHQQLPFSTQPQLTLATAVTHTTTSTTVANSHQMSSPRPKVSKGCQRDDGDVRPASPVMISRSSQTDLPSGIQNFTLKERPHPLHVHQQGNSQSNLQNSNTDSNGQEWKADHDSDSGYNSPMHRQNLVSSGTQVAPSGVAGNLHTTESAQNSSKPQKPFAQNQTRSTMKKGVSGEGSRVSEEGTDGGNSDKRNVGVDGKKKRRKKKDHRDSTRSPRTLGTNSKLLSRSSSSISSAGTKPEDDDEKIDLHSWTDFPPMSARVATSGTSSKPAMKSPLTAEERVPLTIERSAHEPPWSIKFSSTDESKSVRSRSSSGDVDKNLGQNLISPPDSAWGKIGRTFKSSQAPGLGEELSVLMSKSETVPMLTSSGRRGSGSNGPSRNGSANPSRHNSGGGGGSGCASPNTLHSDLTSTPAEMSSRSVTGVKRGEKNQTGRPPAKSGQKFDNANAASVSRANRPQGEEDKWTAKSAWTTVNTKSQLVSSTSATLSSSSSMRSTITTTTTTTTTPTTSTTTLMSNQVTSYNNTNITPCIKNAPNGRVSQQNTGQWSARPQNDGSGKVQFGGMVAPAANRQGSSSGASSNTNNTTSDGHNNRGNNKRRQESAIAPTAVAPPSSLPVSADVKRSQIIHPSGMAVPSADGANTMGNFTGSLPAGHPMSVIGTPSVTSPLMHPAAGAGIRGPRPDLPASPLLTGNYCVPPPSQPSPVVPVGGAPISHPPPFRSYANITQGALPLGNPAVPNFPPRGTSHPVNSPAYPGGIAGPHVSLPPPSASFPAYYAGAVTQRHQSPNPHAGLSHNPPHTATPPNLSTQLHSPVPAAPNASISSTYAASKLPNQHSAPPSISKTNRHPSGGAKVQDNFSNSKTADINSNSLNSPSTQQLYSHAHMKPVDDGTKVTIISPQDEEGEEKKKRRRRRRRRRSKRGEGEGSDGSQNLEHAISSSNVSESTLHFEDADEFPDLLSSSSRALAEDVGGERATLSGTSITYSDIIKSTWSKAGSGSRTQSLTGSCISGDNDDDEDNTSCHTGTTIESKRARKRRKRREQANKAAEAELAEISLEQQWLKEVGLKKSANHKPGELTGAKTTPGVITDSSVVSEAKKQGAGKGGGKKSQQPIAFDIAAMIDAIQKKPTAQATTSSLSKQHSASSSSIAKSSKKDRERAAVGGGGTATNLPGNVLDSSAPVQKRGKERESGKVKKPSPLKKVILKEREQRKRLRLLDEDPDSATGLDGVGSPGVGIVGGESELSQDALSSKSEGTEGGDVSGGAAELSADLSPISQTSPISMSPASPGNSGVNSPVTGSIGRDPVVMKIHSRRFREYCTQILDKEIDQCCTSLLQDLVKFQDRMYHKDPVKAKTKRRVVLGLREVTKHLKLKKIKCVVISPNLEKIQSKGGLDEALNNILNMCREQDVPFVFALGRRALGRACAKLVPVSVVGIFNYEGCESKYRSLISLTEAARSAYNEMVLAVEKEVAEYPTMASQTSSIGGVPGLFAAHMGHSRTPSGCSAISFTSSILSEPISENFPHAEPEVDSKGYEIVRDAAGNVVHPSGGGTKSRGMANDIDDGNEADTEDFGDMRRKKKGGRNLNSVRFGDMGESVTDGARGTGASDKPSHIKHDGTSDDLVERGSMGKLSRNVSESTLTNEDNFILKGESYAAKHMSSLEGFDDQEDENDEELDEEINGNNAGKKDLRWDPVPHIDSIHSINYNLREEILSHHLSRNARSKGQGQAVMRGQKTNDGGDDDEEDDDDDDDGVDDENVVEDGDEEDEEEDEEEREEAVKRHQRVIDKERIKNWLESQTNIGTED